MTKTVKNFAILNSFSITSNPCKSLEKQGFVRSLQRESKSLPEYSKYQKTLYFRCFYAHFTAFLTKLDISVALFWQCCGFFYTCSGKCSALFHFNYSNQKIMPME